MGFLWSLFFAQRISERLMSQVPSLWDSHLSMDRGAPTVFSDQASGQSYHHVYVDNLGVISRSRDRVTDGFTRHGLLLHAGEVGHERTPTPLNP